MSFCPSCGAQNADDARFCNKCGSAISAGAAARSGVPVAAPPPTNTSGPVTLSGIGIQSPGKTYAVLAVGALLFLGLGAGIAWVGMHSGAASTTAAAETTGGGGGASGDALPDGVDVPDEDFVMTSGARVVKRGPSASTGGGDTPPSSGTTPPSSAATGGHTPPPPTTSATHAPSHTGSGSTPPTSTTHGGSSAPSDPTTPPSTGTSTGSGTSPPPTSAPDWDALSGTVDPSEEPDYQMQMYSTQVRRFIRQYLLPQATSCFEHASAVSRDPVSGTVAIGFDINARGHAEGATIDRNTTGNDALARCLQNNVNTWQLPPPPEGTAPIQMQMPFTR